MSVTTRIAVTAPHAINDQDRVWDITAPPKNSVHILGLSNAGVKGMVLESVLVRKFSLHYSQKAHRLFVGGFWSVSTWVNFACILLWFSSIEALPAAASPAKDRPGGSAIRLNVELFMVPVTVTDKRG